MWFAVLRTPKGFSRCYVTDLRGGRGRNSLKNGVLPHPLTGLGYEEHRICSKSGCVLILKIGEASLGMVVAEAEGVVAGGGRREKPWL